MVNFSLLTLGHRTAPSIHVSSVFPYSFCMSRMCFVHFELCSLYLLLQLRSSYYA
jgi:hypothetical protein